MFTSLELISGPTLRREAERKEKFPPEAVLRAREGVINAPLRCDRSRSGRSFSHRCSLRPKTTTKMRWAAFLWTC